MGREGGGAAGRGVTFGRGMEGVVLVLAMEASVWTREVRMGVERDEAIGGMEVRVGREGEPDVRDDTNCDGVSPEKLCVLGGVLGDGVKETGGGTPWPRRGLPERV